MAKQALSKQFDTILTAALASRQAPRTGAEISADVDPELNFLVSAAMNLRDLPREDFRMNLQSDLERSTSMANKAVAVPKEMQTAIPYLCIANAAEGIDFYKKAFGAVEVMRVTQPDGRVGHAEIRIGNSSIMLADEFPDYGFLGPRSMGGSPVKMHLQVEDVDARAKQAVAAGAQVVRPVQDQFYGERSGQFADPFGYTWILSQQKEILSEDEIKRRFEAFTKQQVAATSSAARPIPQGYRTITPYLIARNVPALIEFMSRSFDAVENFRAIGSAGGFHAEVRVGNSAMMIGGGGPGISWSGKAMPTALHVYVPNVDDVYDRALKAGATAMHPPSDKPYGERGATVIDAEGNHWHIAHPTVPGKDYDAETHQTVRVYLYPLRAESVINFVKNAFGAEEREKHATPEGVILHASVKIGDSTLEMGEPGHEYPPMPTTFYLYVRDADSLYARAVQAGATSLSTPTDQPYGDRVAGVKDAFGNTWYIATRIKDVQK